MDDIEMSMYNPRKDLQPGDEEYENLRRSIKEFGYVSPIIVNEKDNRIIGGHQRYKVLNDLGFTEIDVVKVNLDEESEKILNLSLNKISGEWDLEQLENLLAEFEEEDIDPTLTGFKESEIDDLLGRVEAEEAADETEDSSQETDTTIVCPKCQYVDDKKEFEI